MTLDDLEWRIQGLPKVFKYLLFFIIMEGGRKGGSGMEMKGALPDTSGTHRLRQL